MQVGVHLVLPKKTQSRPRKYLWNICDASGILLGGELQGELERIRQVPMAGTNDTNASKAGIAEGEK